MSEIESAAMGTMLTEAKAQFERQKVWLEKEVEKLRGEITVLNMTVSSLHQMVAAAVQQSAAAIQQNAWATARIDDFLTSQNEFRETSEPHPTTEPMPEQGHTAERHAARSTPPNLPNPVKGELQE